MESMPEASAQSAPQKESGLVVSAIKAKARRIKKKVEEPTPPPVESKMRRELAEGFKNPEKLAKLSKIVDEHKAEKKIKDKEIAEIRASIQAPKAQKKELIEKIEEMVTDPVDVMKLRLDKKSKSDLQTLFINIKAQYDWHKKNKPGQAIDYDFS